MGTQFVTLYQIAPDQYLSLSALQFVGRAIVVCLLLTGFLLLSLLINKRVRRNYRLAVGVVFLGIALVVLVITGVSYLNQTDEAWHAFQEGHYRVVEGPVEQFDPMPVEGHKLECFIVQGTKFCYSDYVIAPGFRNTASHGGPIREGLLVRIAYLTTGTRNVILRLQAAR